MARNFKIVGGGGSAAHVDVGSELGRVGWLYYITLMFFGYLII